MEKKNIDEIQGKNITDIISENLRIIESSTNLENSPPKRNDNQKLTSKVSLNKRENFSDDELNVTILELKNLVRGKMVIRKIRQLLHREIHDWIVFPLQQKQSEINRKIARDFTEVYNELDFSSQRIDEQIQKLNEVDIRIDEQIQKLNEVDIRIDEQIGESDEKLNEIKKSIFSELISINAELSIKNNKEFLKENQLLETKIKQVYQKMLGRDPDPVGLGHYFYKISLGQIKLNDIEIELKKSSEHKLFSESQKILNYLSSKIDKPIFIVGVPRSGTTFLHSIMCNHEDLAWISHEDIPNWLSNYEQFEMESFYNWLKTNNKKIPIFEEALFVFGESLGDGLKEFGTPPKGSLRIPVEGEIFWRQIFGTDYVEDIHYDKKIKLMHEMLRVTKEQKKNRFVGKAPNNSFRLFALKKIFPDAKFINVARDPRAVVSSMLYRYNKEGEFDLGEMLKRSQFQPLDSIERFALRYQQITDCIWNFSNQNSVFSIQYEELLKNPKETLQKILNFCELDFAKSIDEMIPTIREGTLDKWKRNLTQKNIEQISTIVNTSIRQMNYPYQL